MSIFTLRWKYYCFSNILTLQDQLLAFSYSKAFWKSNFRSSASPDVQLFLQSFLLICTYSLCCWLVCLEIMTTAMCTICLKGKLQTILCTWVNNISDVGSWSRRGGWSFRSPVGCSWSLIARGCCESGDHRLSQGEGRAASYQYAFGDV